MNDILSALHWRYATKQFDPQRKLTPEQLRTLTESARLAPSSYGLQPWKFVVVSNAAVRQQLRAHAYDQPQITDASHLIVLCSLDTLTADYVRHFVDEVAAQRSTPREQLADYEQMLVDFVTSLTPEEARAWMQKQVYIALGTLLTAAAVQQIDACPMEGFEPEKFDEVLQLHEHGVRSAVLCTLGFRMPTDSAAQRQKVRLPHDEVYISVL